MKRKTKKALENTKSGLKEQKQRLTTPFTKKESIEAKTMKGKKDILHLEEVAREKSSLSSSANAPKAKQKKSSASSPQGNKLQKNKGSLKKPSNHDVMPELSFQDMTSLKSVSKEKIENSKKAKVFTITEKGRTEISQKQLERRAGRPQKKADLKEKNHIVRFSDQFLALLKRRAEKAGYIGWQTYLKSVVAKEIGFKEII